MAEEKTKKPASEKTTPEAKSAPATPAAPAKRRGPSGRTVGFIFLGLLAIATFVWLRFFTPPWAENFSLGKSPKEMIAVADTSETEAQKPAAEDTTEQVAPKVQPPAPGSGGLTAEQITGLVTEVVKKVMGQQSESIMAQVQQAIANAPLGQQSAGLTADQARQIFAEELAKSGQQAKQLDAAALRRQKSDEIDKLLAELN